MAGHLGALRVQLSHPRPPRLPDPTPLLTEALLTEKDREKDAVLMTEGASSP